MFSERLKELRLSKGITQMRFAQEFNIANGTIAMWETGKREPDASTLKRIANYFDVSVDYLIGNDSKKKEPSIQKDEGFSEETLRVAEKFSRLSSEDREKVEEYMMLLSLKDRQ